MNIEDPAAVLTWAVCAVLSLILCPLLTGIINRVKAFFAGRRGPKLFQLYYDMAKLLRKGSVYSATATDMIRLAPLCSLAALLTCTLFLPFGTVYSPFSFTGDVLLFIYLLGFARVATVLGALDTGSSFEGMGASRELQFSAMAEGAFLCIIGFLVMLTGNFSLSGILTGFDGGAWLVCGTSMLLIFVALAIILLVESCRVPFDDPETHLELTMIHEAMILDYSGPDLAMIFYGGALKLWLLSSLLVMLLLPFSGLSGIWNAVLYFGGVFLTAAGIGAVESIMARFRFLKVPQMLIGALCGSIVAVLLMILFDGGAK